MTYIKLGIIQVAEPWVRWWVGYRAGGQVVASASALPSQSIEIPTGSQITGIYLGKPEFGTIGIPLADLGYLFFANLNTVYTVDVNMLAYPPEIGWHSEDITPPPAGPTIAVNPASLAFTAPEGGNIAAQSVTIFNSGTGAMSWQASVNNSRINLSATAGNSPSTITVSVNIAGLPPGQYPAIVSIVAAGATNNPLAFPIAIVVSAVIPPPPIGDMAVIILDQIITDIPFQTWWLGIVGPTGTIATPKVGLAGSVTIPVPCIISGVELGDATGWGVKDIDGWSFSPLLRVETPGTYKLYVNTLEYPWIAYVTPITAPPPPTAITAEFTANVLTGVAPLTVQFTDLSAGGPISWAWQFGDGATSTSQNPSHIYSAPGTYNVRLTIGKGTATNQVIKNGYIVVTTVAPPPPPPPPPGPNPAIGVTPASLTFASQVGSNPANQTIAVRNIGTGTLEWTAITDNPRITMTPLTGLSTGEVDPIEVSIVTADLPVGQYSGTITIQGIGIDPVTIAVNLNITATPIPPPPPSDGVKSSWIIPVIIGILVVSSGSKKRG